MEAIINTSMPIPTSLAAPVNQVANHVFEKKGQVLTSSRLVAEYFGKRHDNVLRDIQSLECSTEFNLLNFEEIYYKDEMNRKQPEYLMTKDGFIFLIMGFRGKKAAAIKEAYIAEFNQMHEFIADLYALRAEHPEFTEAIRLAHGGGNVEHYHYSNESDMINRIAIGMSAKEFKISNSLDLKTGSIRPYLNKKQLDDTARLQKADIGLLIAVPDFQTRKAILTQYHQQHQQLALLH